MIDFSANLVATPGNDVGSLIAQILADNALAIAQKGRMSVEVFDKVVRRSLGRTGSAIFRNLKAGFRNKSLRLQPLRIHPANGVVMTEMLSRTRPWELIRGVTPEPLTLPKKPGENLAKLMQYELDEHDGKNVTVGLIPKRRGGDKWARRFKNWQEAGEIELNDYANGNERTMFNYFKALGMPIRKHPARPERDVIGQVEARTKPIQMFEKFFLERLLK